MLVAQHGSATRQHDVATEAALIGI
jgi:hypothetical protein